MKNFLLLKTSNKFILLFFILAFFSQQSFTQTQGAIIINGESLVTAGGTYGISLSSQNSPYLLAVGGSITAYGRVEFGLYGGGFFSAGGNKASNTLSGFATYYLLKKKDLSTILSMDFQYQRDKFDRGKTEIFGAGFSMYNILFKKSERTKLLSQISAYPIFSKVDALNSKLFLRGSLQYNLFVKNTIISVRPYISHVFAELIDLRTDVGISVLVSLSHF